MLDRGDTHGNGQHHADERCDRHGGKYQDWPATKPASVRPRSGGGPGRGGDLPPGVICDRCRCHRRWWRLNCCRNGQGIRRTARVNAEIVPQIMSQSACLLRDLGGAARSPGRIFGDELHH
jgi:hypothetical protein